MNLPNLPSPMYGPDTSVDEDCRGAWSEDQMREYARAALAAQPGSVGLCEQICAAIKAADDKTTDEAGYMLDSNDCIAIVRQQFAAAPTEAKPAQDVVDAERWREASRSRNHGITAWGEFGQRTVYDSAADQLIDAAISAKKGQP